MKEKLFEIIKQRGFTFLIRNGADYCYENLKGITEKQSRKITVENMMLYAPGLESDLSGMFS